MSLDLKLKLDTKEKGAVADYLSKNKKTKFSVGLLSLDKDYRFNDGILSIKQEGVGEFDLEVKDGSINRFLLTLHYPGKENLELKIGGTVKPIGLKGKTINPRLELKVGDIIVTGEATGKSLKENIRKFDGDFSIKKGNKEIKLKIEDGKLIGISGDISFDF